MYGGENHCHLTALVSLPLVSPPNLVNFYFNYKKIPNGIVERLRSPYFSKAPPHRLLPNPLLRSNSGRAIFMFVQHFIALTDWGRHENDWARAISFDSRFQVKKVLTRTCHCCRSPTHYTCGWGCTHHSLGQELYDSGSILVNIISLEHTCVSRKLCILYTQQSSSRGVLPTLLVIDQMKFCLSMWWKTLICGFHMTGWQVFCGVGMFSGWFQCVSNFPELEFHNFAKPE